MAPSWKEVETEEEVENLHVTLPTILGIPPERYLPVFYGSLLLVLLFLILIVPGIRRYGTVMTVVSAPSGASVMIDGVRYGPTPLEVFLPAGEQTLTLSYPGLEDTTRTVEAGGRLIGSLLVPRRDVVVIPFDRGLSPSGVNYLLDEYHEWALSGDPGPQFQHPPSARVLARALWAASTPDRRDDADRPDRSDLSESEMPSLTDVPSVTDIAASWISGASATQLPDLLGALVRTEAPGAAVTHRGIEALVHLFVQYDNDYPGFVSVVDRWLSSDLPADPSATASWRDARFESLSTELLAASLGLDERGLPRSEGVTLGDIPFVRVPEGTYILGYPARDAEETSIPVEIDQSFYLMEHEVTVRSFAAFVRDNPDWAPERSGALKAAGLVDDRYLMDWPANWNGVLADDAPPELRRFGTMPVRYVSWYAASAYADWFSRSVDGGTLPGLGGELRVSLPGTVGWEYAAFLDSLGPATRVVEGDAPVSAREGAAGALGLFHMRGNLWEWTADWYAENVPILPAPVASQRAVIGGSYANPLLPLGTVGSQPPDWCTPFLGFRLAVYGTDSEHSDGEHAERDL